MHWFQSRNREAFHFRRGGFIIALQVVACFNLVIERLFISGFLSIQPFRIILMFQSRNREAFHFRNWPRGLRPVRSVSRFNLVIERLFISGKSAVQDRGANVSGFNLVIERLFISGVYRRDEVHVVGHVSIS